MKPDFNIILCGFMGSGKSTVGRQLAEMTGISFVDMDDYIEMQSGMTIAALFEKYGEPYFRDLEYRAAQDLSKTGGKIIAAGGGTLTFQRNVDVLRTTGKIIFLDPPFEEIKERLRNDTARPLLHSPDREKAMQQLYETRLPAYKRAADCIIPTSGTPFVICKHILSKLGLTQNNR